MKQSMIGVRSTYPFVYIAIGGFASGVCVRSFFDFGWPFMVFIGMVAMAVVLLFFATSRSWRTLVVGVFLFSVAFGVLRFDLSEQFIDRGLEPYVGSDITIHGVVTEEPDRRDDNTHLTVSVEQALIGERIREVDTKVLVFADLFSEREYGDRVVLSGQLVKPEAFTTDTGRVFDYPEFLKKDGIHYQMFSPDVFLVSKDAGNPIKGSLFFLKQKLLSQIQIYITEPQSALLGGLLVGVKQSLGEGLLDAFRATGIIHIVVLSGYNVTIVAEAIMRFFAFTPMRTRMLLGAGSILAFMVMVGAGATVVRASVMALLVILARAFGRMYDIALALALAGFTMVFINPYILVFDPSFQLSFLATIGLIYLVPILESKLHFMPKEMQLKEFALATIGTQIFVLPLLLYMTGELSVVAVFVNMLVLVVIPATMLFGFLTGVFGFVSGTLGSLFGFFTYGLLTYILQVVKVFDALPFTSITVPAFSAGVVVLLYLGLIYLIWRSSGRYTFMRPDAVGGEW